MPPKSKFKSPSKQSNTQLSNTSSSQSGPVVLHWHRTDLRLHDSPSLHAALSLNPTRFIPLWTWDPHYVYRARASANRWKFLVDSMQDLSGSYSKLPIDGGQGRGEGDKQRLFVVREAPETVFPKLFKVLGVTHLVFEKDTDSYAKARDEKVVKLAKGAGVEVIVKSGRTLFDIDEVVKANGGKPTMSMTQLKKATEKMEVAKPLPVVEKIPGCGKVISDLRKTESEHKGPGGEVWEKKLKGEGDMQQNLRSHDDKVYKGGLLGPNGDCGVPTLEEMGIEMGDATGRHKGGEAEALRLLKNIIDDEEYTATFEKPASAPTDFEPQSTTLLSPHHHFGTLSVRRFWWDVVEAFEKRKKAGKRTAAEPMNLFGQLLFRDMYFAAQAAIGWEFAQTRGNKVARFVDWKLQSNYDSNGLLDGTYNVDDEQAEEWFRRWKEARTGFPWIDALMRQLEMEGWIHHLGRHAVACFLTRGGCYVHWERGAEVFEEWLIDHEVACNVGNWMWLSCTAFFSQFYRCYSPVSFPKKWDPDGNFVRKYVPELAKFDKKYIYEPHKAPIADQKKWGCMIKGDGTEKKEGQTSIYPKPMFEFNERRKFCIDKIKEAYDMKLYGDNEKVMNGKWKSSFDFDDKGARRKDEANGYIDGEKGAKRNRDTEEEHWSDDGADADQGDANDEKPPRKAPKKSAKGKKDQGTLDIMVTRKRAN